MVRKLALAIVLTTAASIASASTTPPGVTFLIGGLAVLRGRRSKIDAVKA
jgi:hypothetical protein